MAGRVELAEEQRSTRVIMLIKRASSFCTDAIKRTDFPIRLMLRLSRYYTLSNGSLSVTPKRALSATSPYKP